MTRGQIAIITPEGKLNYKRGIQRRYVLRRRRTRQKKLWKPSKALKPRKNTENSSMILTTDIFDIRIGRCFTTAMRAFTICQRTTSASGFPITSISKTFRAKRSCLPTPINRKSRRNLIRLPRSISENSMRATPRTLNAGVYRTARHPEKRGSAGIWRKNYANLWNACADYDNNHRGSYLTGRIQEYDFVDDEILEYIVKEESLGGISRLRCFIGDTYDANLYRLDGYGNLANVDNSDFEDLIDDIVQTLEEDITPHFIRSLLAYERKEG